MLSPHGSSSTSSAGQFTSEPSSILTETKDIIIPCDSPETASDTPTHLPCETTLEKEC